MPFKVALLPLQLTPQPSDPARLLAASHLVTRTGRLYVSLDGDWSSASLDEAEARIQKIYALATKWRQSLDVRVLLPAADSGSSSVVAHLADLDALLTTSGVGGAEPLLRKLNHERAAAGLMPIRCHALPEWPFPAAEPEKPHDGDADAGDSSAWLGSGGHVCVGGTFDRLHAGHKLLLTKAALLAERDLLIGVTDAPLLRRKQLRELMQPLAHRAAIAEEFVRSVRPGLRCNSVALSDPLGPAATDPELNTLVASAETAKGAQVANEKRRDARIPPLWITEARLVSAPRQPSGSRRDRAVSASYPVASVTDDGGDLRLSDSAEDGDGGGEDEDEIKLSSSDARRRALGSFLRPVACWRPSLDAMLYPFYFAGSNVAGNVIPSQSRALALAGYAAAAASEDVGMRTTPRPTMGIQDAALAAQLGQQTPHRGEWTRKRGLRGPYIVGLTGGIASGKSTIAAILKRKHGVAVIDADKLGHELYNPGGAAVKAIVAAFGEGVRDSEGGIDRKMLGKLVWGDSDAMAKLSGLMWPRILRLAARRAIEAARKGADLVIIEAAVLLEAGWDNICDEVWLCSVSEDEQKRRLMQRDELDEVSASERIAHQARTQLDVTERSGRVHVVLSTEGCEEVLQEAVDGSPHGGESSTSGSSKPRSRGGPLARQVRKSLAGARARSMLRLPSAAVGTAASLWYELCDELHVGQAARRHWWRWLVERHSVKHLHCHGLSWMRRIAREVHARREEAAHPIAVRLASFFTHAEASGGPEGKDALTRFARCAPGLKSKDARLAARLVESAAVAAHGGSTDVTPMQSTQHDFALLHEAERGIREANPAVYARYASRLWLERRCTTAALRDGGGVGSAVDEARQRVEEIEAALKDEGQGFEEFAGPNLEVEKRALEERVLIK